MEKNVNRNAARPPVRRRALLEAPDPIQKGIPVHVFQHVLPHPLRHRPVGCQFVQDGRLQFLHIHGFIRLAGGGPPGGGGPRLRPGLGESGPDGLVPRPFPLPRDPDFPAVPGDLHPQPAVFRRRIPAAQRPCISAVGLQVKGGGAVTVVHGHDHVAPGKGIARGGQEQLPIGAVPQRALLLVDMAQGPHELQAGVFRVLQ